MLGIGVICDAGGPMRAHDLPRLSFIENAKSRCLLCKRREHCVQARFLNVRHRKAPTGVSRPMGALGMVLVVGLWGF